MDDSALFGQTVESCGQNITDTVSLMDSLGFTIHPEKSCFQPTHTLIYLGFVLDSMEMIVTIPIDRQTKVKKACEALLNEDRVTIRRLAEVIGMLVALEPGADYAPIYYKRSEIYKTDMLKQHKGNFERKIKVVDEVREDLQWWCENIHEVQKKLRRQTPSVNVTSDSSDFAWGGARDGTSTGGPWSEEERPLHINVKELKAVYLTLCTFVTWNGMYTYV